MIRKVVTDHRVILAVVAMTLGYGLSYALPQWLPAPAKIAARTNNFPAQACPAISTAGVTTTYLPSTKLGLRFIDGKSTSFQISSRSLIQNNGHSLLVDSNPGTSLSFSSLPSSGTAAIPCSAGNPDEWFVGGSGGLTSKGTLNLVNSGLSESSIDIYPFTSKAALPVLSVTVKANSAATIQLDALAPGDDSMALHIITRTGRVSSFVLDQRAKGLRALGLDYVKPVATPEKELYISGIYPHNGDKSSVAHSLRLLAPGSLDATVRVQVISADGKFVPVGFDGLTVTHNQVLTLPLKNLTMSSPFGLLIESDQPILASVFTAMGSGDFAWAASGRPLATTTMNFGGATPTLTFVGKAINLQLVGRYSNGKSFSQQIQANDIADWTPKIGVNAVHLIVPEGEKIFAGAIINSGMTNAAGLTYLPIAPGVSIENTALPFNDVRTLTH